MVGRSARGVVVMLVLNGCGALVEDSSPGPARASDGRELATEWPEVCNPAPSEFPSWSPESCELRLLSVPAAHDYVVGLVTDSSGIFLLLGDPATSTYRADARLYRYSFEGALEAEAALTIGEGAQLVGLADGVALIDHDVSRFLRLRRLDRGGAELERYLLETPSPVEYTPKFNALWAEDQLHVVYLFPRPGDAYANAGFIHFARFARGAADFDVRLTDPSGFVTPGDIQPWCGGTAVTSYRTREDGVSEIYLSYIDDSGKIAGESMIDRDAPQRMNSTRTSFLDVAADGTLLLTWVDSSLTRKDFTPANAISIASLGFDGALGEPQRLDLGRLSDVAGVHFAGELRVGLSRLEDESSAVLRVTPDAERIDQQTLGERITELRAFVPTPAGFAGLTQRRTPDGVSGSVLAVGSCRRDP
jgi:hypothetical protein